MNDNERYRPFFLDHMLRAQARHRRELPSVYLREWEKAIGFDLQATPHLSIDPVFRQLRVDLLGEEWGEYVQAENDSDIVNIADALADMAYIIYGTAAHYGIDLDAVIAEVHRSNMTKVVDGKVIKREDGKILKPDTYQAPDIPLVLGLGLDQSMTPFEVYEEFVRLSPPPNGVSD